MCQPGFAEYGEFPFGEGPYTGMRQWHVNGDRELMGKWLNPWRPGETVAAVPEGHVPPCFDPVCGCGLWAFWGRPVGVWVAPEVVGVIEGSGRLVAGPDGFRAERARIVELALPDYRIGPKPAKWPPSKGTEWVISNNDDPEQRKEKLETTMPLDQLALHLGEYYQVPCELDRFALQAKYRDQLGHFMALRDQRRDAPIIPAWETAN